MIDESLYETPGGELMTGVTRLAEVIAGTDALETLCRPTLAGTEGVVVVGMGDDPWDGRRMSREQLEGIHCRVFIGPQQGEWAAIQVDEDVTYTVAASSTLRVKFRRQVSAAEIDAVGMAAVHRWFWGTLGLLMEQVVVGSESAGLCFREWSGDEEPLWNTLDERATQGCALHAEAAASIGDSL